MAATGSSRPRTGARIKCCVKLAAAPVGNAPPAAAGDVLKAVTAACGGTFTGSLYDIGDKVEAPAPAVVKDWRAVAAHAFANKAACQQACTDRSRITITNNWLNPALPAGAIAAFKTACDTQSCDALFPAP